MYKIAFLDRDGVINKSNINGGYIGKIKDFTWMPGAKKTIKYLKENEYIDYLPKSCKSIIVKDPYLALALISNIFMDQLTINFNIV